MVNYVYALIMLLGAVLRKENIPNLFRAVARAYSAGEGEAS